MQTLLSSPQTILELKGRINLWPKGPVVVADFTCMRPTGRITNAGKDEPYPVPTHEQFLQVAEHNVSGLKFTITPYRK